MAEKKEESGNSGNYVNINGHGNCFNKIKQGINTSKSSPLKVFYWVLASLAAIAAIVTFIINYIL